MNDQSIVSLIKVQFELDLSEDDFEQVRKFLIEKIQYLLSHNSEKLWWILYRIDISENKAMEALQAEPKEKGIERLADLIIERQIEKMITRQKYQRDAGDWQ